MSKNVNVTKKHIYYQLIPDINKAFSYRLNFSSETGWTNFHSLPLPVVVLRPHLKNNPVFSFFFLNTRVVKVLEVMKEENVPMIIILRSLGQRKYMVWTSNSPVKELGCQCGNVIARSRQSEAEVNVYGLSFSFLFLISGGNNWDNPSLGWNCSL